MSFDHNRMTHDAAVILLNQLQKGQASWATNRLTTKSTYWHGLVDWPRPDIAFEDFSTGSSLAIEFKPPGQSKREYVTGLGQTLTYLRSFEFAAIILPKRANDGFEIAEYLCDNLNEQFAVNLPVGLFSYDKNPGDPTDLLPLINLRPRTGNRPPIPKGVGKKVFWAYWRDLSQHDILSVLSEMDTRKPKNFDSAYKFFWKSYMEKRRAQTWEGFHRKAKRHSTSYNAERLNAFLSLRHIGVISSKGLLTEEGFNLLRNGKIYSASSVTFMSKLGDLILENGRHLELIFWVDEQQRNIPKRYKKTAIQFYQKLDESLQLAGIIPRAPKGKPKATFLRDEQKLWNKLGLLIPYNRGSYFHPGIGLIFNWRTITDIIA